MQKTAIPEDQVPRLEVPKTVVTSAAVHPPGLAHATGVAAKPPDEPPKVFLPLVEFAATAYHAADVPSVPSRPTLAEHFGAIAETM